VEEWDESAALEAKDGADLGGVDAVVGTIGKEAAFCLNAEITVEVAGDAGDRSRIDGHVGDVAEGAVAGVEVSIAGVEVKA
jgi:hypothetical protein